MTLQCSCCGEYAPAPTYDYLYLCCNACAYCYCLAKCKHEGTDKITCCHGERCMTKRRNGD